jgi:hypothetical protein
MDGAGARRLRAQRRITRYAIWVAIVGVLAIAISQLPSMDPAYLLQGAGRPILAGALLTMLGAAALLALARVRRTSTN